MSTLSDETLKLLDSAADKFDRTKENTSNQPQKRKHHKLPERDNRTGYPKQSKALYLKTKTLHRKKLNMAINIHQIKKSLQDKKFPTQENLNCNVPANKDSL